MDVVAIKIGGGRMTIDEAKEIVQTQLHDWAFSREEILRIIDKYKASPTGAESEE